ncbi:YndJ family protein [Evansella sp. AB-P1]|uniref:YndJ family protein n=1 Tax=Evansella sp. AB-P1 TaxID=3037653 RepID=UPI00241E26F9|nr:YndJ family protein [Evansella sp. AB-P1]MDG5786188.1 YndJ family protein [Evansella sp. AB-P1]
MKKKTFNKVIGIGASTWLVIILFFPIELIEAMLSFSFFVLVPIVLTLTFERSAEGFIFTLYRVLQFLYYPSALLATIGLFISPGFISGLFSLIWLIYTIILGGYGLGRLLYRGGVPHEELVIDAAFIFLVLGGGWLVLHQFGVEGLPFSSVIVLLTAIHFHYSSFIVLIFTGMLGRFIVQNNLSIRGYSFIIYGMIAGPLLVAAGITIGGVLEFISVVVYVILLYWLGGITIWIMLSSSVKSWGNYCIAFSSMCLLGTMALSFLYSYGITFGPFLLTIPDMVLFHGVGNAFFYAFIGVLGWLKVKPDPRDDYYSVEISQLRGKGAIGESFIKQSDLIDDTKEKGGLVDQFHTYRNESFHTEAVHPTIQHFYENTTAYRMKAKTKWHRGFRFLSKLYHTITSSVEQLNLEPHRASLKEQEMIGQVIPIKEKMDGREDPRVWIRKDNEENHTIFVAIYSYYEHENIPYMNIALPLPRSVMTGVLRFNNDQDNGLILTTKRKRDRTGHEGIYLTFRSITVRLPISESFHIKEVGQRRLTAKHSMTLWGFPCLTIDYSIWMEK